MSWYHIAAAIVILAVIKKCWGLAGRVSESVKLARDISRDEITKLDANGIKEKATKVHDVKKVEPITVHGEILALHNYHPNRGGTNAKFDFISKKIYDLKRSDMESVRYFSDELEQIIPKDVVVCIVPTSQAGTGENATIGLVAKRLCPGRIDGIRCLFRTNALEKKLRCGGARDKTIHETSIAVSDADVIRDRVVWLLDDVVTTGNSMLVCAAKLRDYAKEVHCLAIGATVYYNGLRGR